MEPVEYHVLKEMAVDDEGEPTEIACSCGWQWQSPSVDELTSVDDFKQSLRAHLQEFGIDSNPVGTGMPNSDLADAWKITTPGQARHFGLPWKGASPGYTLILVTQRQTGAHGTLVLPTGPSTPWGVSADGKPIVDGGPLGFREGWPEEWPEHDTSNCRGHGHN